MRGGRAAQNVPVQEVVLDNGLRVLMVPRKGDPNIAAGWVARVGSVNERPGITGLSHLFEHMMFKGTHAIGTTNIDEDLKLMERDGRRAARGSAREEQALIRRATARRDRRPEGPEGPLASSHQQLLAQLRRADEAREGADGQGRVRPDLHRRPAPRA